MKHKDVVMVRIYLTEGEHRMKTLSTTPNY